MTVVRQKNAGSGPLLPLAVLVTACCLIFAPLLVRMTRSSDYRWHLEAAGHLAEKPLAIPHPLFHVIARINETLFGLLPGLATAHLERLSQIWTALSLYLLLAVLLFSALRTVLGWRLGAGRASWTAAMLAFVLLLVHPLFLFVPTDGLRYLGYIAVNAHHNPTIVALKPFALLSFLLACAAFPGGVLPGDASTATLRKTLLAAAVTVVSALAKPNFVLCLLPSLLIYGAWRGVRRLPVDWPYLLRGFVLPILAVLGLQFVLFGQGGNAVQLAPFAVMGQYSGHLGLKLPLSLAFPLTVQLLFWNAARRDAGLNLAWLMLGCGLFSVYFLSESTRLRAGNFGWSAQISLFLLIVTSTAFLICRSTAPELKDGGPEAGESAPALRLRICWTVLALHALSGALYLMHLFRTGGKYH